MPKSKPPLKNKRLRKSSLAPIRPRSAYNFFLKAKLQVLKNQEKEDYCDSLNGRELQASRIRQISQEWSILSSTKRAPYLAEATQDQARYQEELERYRGGQAERKLFVKNIDLRKTQNLSKKQEVEIGKILGVKVAEKQSNYNK